jgi:hypothetical protein
MARTSFSYLCGGLRFTCPPLSPRIGNGNALLLLELVLNAIRTRRKSEDGKKAWLAAFSSKARA